MPFSPLNHLISRRLKIVIYDYKFKFQMFYILTF